MNKTLNTKNILSIILILSIFSIILYIIIKKYKNKPTPTPGPKPSPGPTPEKVECSLDKDKLKKCNVDSDCNCKEDNFSCIEVTKDIDYVIHTKDGEEGKGDNNPCIFAPLGKWCLPKL